MIKIYLACPYSHKLESMRELRFYIANQEAARLMAEGYIVFSPISHSHPIAVQCALPKDYEFWKQFDEALIGWCDEVHVICIAGWEESDGVAREIEYAKKQGKPIKYIKERRLF